MEEINVGEKVYYKKDKWRGPAKVIGKEGKTVVVKQGSDVRETNRSHVIKVRKRGIYFDNDEINKNSENDENERENDKEESEDEEEMVGMVERKEGDGGEEENEDERLKKKRKLTVAISKKRRKQRRRRSSGAMKRRLKMGTRVRGRRER